MIYVSFVEMLGGAHADLAAIHGDMRGGWMAIISFFAGIALIGFIDRFVPEQGNPHEVKRVEQMETRPQRERLLRLGFFTALAISLHNFPEGFATFIATGSRKKAFVHSFLTGLAEPVGALVGFLLLLPFLSESVYGMTFAFVAGIMVFISLDELLPAAREYGEHHLAIYGVIGGMLVMALCLVYL